MSFLNWQMRMVPRMDPVSATIAGVGAGVNLLGGIFGKKSADKQATNIEGIAAQSGQQLVDTTAGANQQLTGLVDPVNANINAATAEGVQRVDNSTMAANALLSPYRQSGEEANEQLRQGLLQGGDFNRIATAEDIQLDPGYEFQRAEGQKIAEAQAAAGGSQYSGAQQKALVRYNQNYANTGFTAAFDRYRKQNQDRYDRLFGVSGRGQTAATTSGDNLIGGNKAAAGLITDAANRTGANTLRTGEVTTGRTIDAETGRQGLITDAASVAAGARQQGNDRLWGGITGAANSTLGALQLNKLLKNPSRRVAYI